ncbi:MULTISPECIES: hypothetical protein [unclassified Streptomyces]
MGLPITVGLLGEQARKGLDPVGIAVSLRHHARNATRPLVTLGIT